MELQRYLLIVWRWLWLVVLGTVLAAGMAFIVNRNMTPIYSASATLLINPASSNVGTTDYSSLLTSEQLAHTYSELLRTPEVLDVVIKRVCLMLF